MSYGFSWYSRRSVDEEAGDRLNPNSFTPYTLIRKQPVSSTSSIFTLNHTPSLKESQEHRDGMSNVWNNCIWSVEAKQPQLQIARHYTPLPSSEAGRAPSVSEAEDLAHTLRLLIRAEKNGEVSNYLHNLPDAAEVSLRGPFVELQLPSDLREVIFIAGGTGIAPALQVAHILSKRPGARMHILWNTRHRDECRGGASDDSPLVSRSLARRTASDWDPWSKISRLASFASPADKPASSVEPDQTRISASPDQNLVVRELESLKAAFKAAPTASDGRRGSLAVEYFVDDNNKFVKPKDVSKQMRRVAQDEEDQDRQGEKKLILVSGPEGFIELWAGKKVWMGGKEMQGPLGGYFSHLGLTARDWKIWKL